jgi:hypothetical protein
LYVYVLLKFTFEDHAMCSLGLSATSQQYFSLRTNQPQPVVLFSQNKPAPAISHQPAVLFSQDKPATSQQYSSLRTNQHQPSATSQPNRTGCMFVLYLSPTFKFV